MSDYKRKEMIMEFVVSRTSYLADDERKPCEEAYRKKLTYVDRRIVSSLEEARSKSWFDAWYNSTTNHRVEDGKVAGDRVSEDWVVEIKDLDHLNKFIDRCGDVIISPTHYKEIKREIEIYDTYRE